MLPPRTARTTSQGLRPQHARAIKRPPEPAPIPWKPPFRLRHLLTLSVVGGIVGTTYPRVRAAWEVHDLAGKTADYASCMVGPTGPQLIRDDIAQFRRLVRRRLVASAPEEAPFKRCAELARVVSGSPEAERAHGARAIDFVEYGLEPARGAAVSTSALAVDLTPLVDRARRAWPFVRGDFSRLVRASLGAKEAVHPVAPPSAGAGRGLPADRAMPRRVVKDADGLRVSIGGGANGTAFVSTDDGVTFRKVRASSEPTLAGECGGRDPQRGFGVSSREDGSLLVTSMGPNREPDTVTAVIGEHRLLAMTCDDQALVLAAKVDGRDSVELVLCAHERACAPLKLPAREPFASLPSEGFDVARVASATVVAVERRGIVRVISTRDDGRTWTPTTVAFDAGDTAPLRADVTVPTRLLAAGQRLYLYGAARRPNDTYALLVSDDQGASFRPPAAVEPTAPAPAAVARTGAVLRK